MSRGAALAALALLCACTKGDPTHAPGAESTLAPGVAFKDGLMYAAIKARLAGADIDSTGRISVVVHSGEVTLRGAVKDSATKEREVKLVRDMRGVKSVNDELRVGKVGPSVAETVRNAGLVAAVAGALTAQAGVNVASISVRADAQTGSVTLAGRAATAAIKSTLVAAARKTPGVRNVIDRISVRQ